MRKASSSGGYQIVEREMIGTFSRHLYMVFCMCTLCVCINSRVEDAASTQVRSLVWLLVSTQSRGVAYMQVFDTMVQYYKITMK